MRNQSLLLYSLRILGDAWGLYREQLSRLKGLFWGDPPNSDDSEAGARNTPSVWLLIVVLISGVAGATTASLIDYAIFRSDDLRATPHLPPIIPDDSLFALQIQVRSDIEGARKYLKRANPELMPVFELWNSKKLYKHGEFSEGAPVFIPEPRPGHDADFAELVFGGLSEIEVHVFGYVSEDHLYKVASKCGLPARSGVNWILQWSTWRRGAGRMETTNCRPGGTCVVLSRGCDADTFGDL